MTDHFLNFEDLLGNWKVLLLHIAGFIVSQDKIFRPYFLITFAHCCLEKPHLNFSLDRRKYRSPLGT